MKNTAYIFKMADKTKPYKCTGEVIKVIKWLKDRQNELLRAPLNRSDKNIDKEIESFTGRLWWHYFFDLSGLQIAKHIWLYMCIYKYIW